MGFTRVLVSEISILSVRKAMRYESQNLLKRFWASPLSIATGGTFTIFCSVSLFTWFSTFTSQRLRESNMTYWNVICEPYIIIRAVVVYGRHCPLKLA